MSAAEKLERERARRHHGSLAVDFLRLVLSPEMRERTVPILDECGICDEPPDVETLVAAIRAAGNGTFPEGKTKEALSDLGLALIHLGVAVCNQTCERFDATSVPNLVDRAPQIADAFDAALNPSSGMYPNGLNPSERFETIWRAVYGPDVVDALIADARARWRKWDQK